MRLGVSSLVGIEPMPFAELIPAMAKHGFDSVEINVGPGYRPIAGAAFPGHLDLAAIVRDGGGEVKELVARHGITISSLAPMINLLTADLTRRAERIEVFRQAIDACVALDVDTIVTFAGSSFGMHFSGLPGVGDGHPSNRIGENLEIFREVYGPMADYAESRGVRIAFETAGRGGGEGNVAHSPALWDLMFEAVPSKAIGLSFDPSHLIWLHIPDVPGVIRRYGERIYHFDGKDTEILRDRLAREGILGHGWWRYRLPGAGDLDWRGIGAALRDIGYDGAIDIENEDPLSIGLAGAAWSADHIRRQLPPPRTA